MIVKRNLDPRIVARHVWRPVCWALLTAVAAVLLRRLAGPRVGVPYPLVGTVGAAVAIFVAFRTNAAYARWWEARTLWGTLHAGCRVLARQLVAGTADAAAAGTADPRDAAAFRRETVLRLIALAHAVRLQLRGQDDPALLLPLLPADEHAALLRRHDRPDALLAATSRRIKEGVRGQLLGAFDPIALEPALGTLNTAIAGCERLADTPTPRQYEYFTRVGVLGFAALLPFGLLTLLPPAQDPLLVALSVLTATLYVVLETVGTVVEAPFAGRATDVPMTYLCRRVERDLRALLGEEDLPEPLRPVAGYLW